MQQKKFNVILDLQWGSCGKGKFAPFLADLHDVHHVSCSHRPNAGHTVRINGDSWVLKCLPSAVVLHQMKMHCYLSAGASYDADQLEQELHAHSPHFYTMHPRSMLVTAEHRKQELELQHIASTMQGAGAALQEKISRRVLGLDSSAAPWLELMRAVLCDHTMLHEAAQGWELSIDHGHTYPYVTSRNCSTAGALDEMGISPRKLGDVYGVLRPFPIRVGNLGANSSGPAHGQELEWEDILYQAGAPKDVVENHIKKYEYTTVTKRKRRVFEFSEAATARAVDANGVSYLILNFAQYLDWEIAGARGNFRRSELPKRVRTFVEALDHIAPVLYLGTGPEHTEVIRLC